MKKLLIWDGDETLWRGTLAYGETPELPPGRAELCAALCERGVLQSLASKNHEPEALAALHANGLSSYFIAPQASFETPKSQMVLTIIGQLGLARASDVVFVDDQAFQRAEVEAGVPGVLVIAPEQIDETVREHFTKAVYTDEDRKRVRRYQSDLLRKAEAKAHPEGYQAFLRSCNLELSVGLAEAADMPRVLDLIARANRMSAVASNFTHSDLHDGDLFVGRVRDRYGDYGLSTVALVRSGRLLLLVVSCQLQGKGIGSAFLGTLINHYVGRLFTAEWVETEYNAGMRQLYDWYKFEVTDGPNVLAHRFIEGAVTLPDWVVVHG